jgi:hypothetical protein
MPLPSEAGAASKAPYSDSNQARDSAVLSQGPPGSAPFSYTGCYFCNRDLPPHNLGVRYRSHDRSSALAATELGIDFVGVEIDRHYLAEAVDRTRSLVADR